MRCDNDSAGSGLPSCEVGSGVGLEEFHLVLRRRRRGAVFLRGVDVSRRQYGVVCNSCPLCASLIDCSQRFALLYDRAPADRFLDAKRSANVLRVSMKKWQHAAARLLVTQSYRIVPHGVARR